MATVTLQIDEYDDLRTAIRLRDEQIADLTHRLDAKLDADQGERERALLTLLRAGLPIIQFAVANCDPLTVPRWPFEGLERFGHLLISSGVDPVLGQELQTVAGEIAVIELARSHRPSTNVADVTETLEGT